MPTACELLCIGADLITRLLVDVEEELLHVIARLGATFASASSGTAVCCPEHFCFAPLRLSTPHGIASASSRCDLFWLVQSCDLCIKYRMERRHMLREPFPLRLRLQVVDPVRARDAIGEGHCSVIAPTNGLDSNSHTQRQRRQGGWLRWCAKAEISVTVAWRIVIAIATDDAPWRATLWL